MHVLDIHLRMYCLQRYLVYQVQKNSTPAACVSATIYKAYRLNFGRTEGRVLLGWPGARPTVWLLARPVVVVATRQTCRCPHLHSPFFRVTLLLYVLLCLDIAVLPLPLPTEYIDRSKQNIAMKISQVCSGIHPPWSWRLGSHTGELQYSTPGILLRS